MTTIVSIIRHLLISSKQAMIDNDLFWQLTDFLPHDWPHRLHISNTGLFTHSQDWTLAVLHILAASRQHSASLYQRDSSAVHRASAGVRGRTARCDLRLRRRHTQRISGSECDERFFADGWRELRDLQSAAESCCTYFYGKIQVGRGTVL